MLDKNDGHIAMLVHTALGEQAGHDALKALAVDPALLKQAGDNVSRAAFAMAMNVILFHDLLRRVPSGARYVAQAVGRGDKILFDHGALRTIRFADGPTGALPAGEDAFTRILIPLGYEIAGLYPLDRLRMTGRAYAHVDMPHAIPQFFLSELHVDRFDPEFMTVANRVFGTSHDPLDTNARALLARFERKEPVSIDMANMAMPGIVSAFDRHHSLPDFADYQTLMTHSNEAAWIATEGNRFNHATDRVADVARLANHLRDQAWPIKDRLEISASERVRQTAFRADSVEYRFADGHMCHVPGSFFEFISRDIDPATGTIDLSFDTGNATGIFAMTSARA